MSEAEKFPWAPKELSFADSDECRKALFELTKLMDKYDLPQVVVNRSEKMQISVLFHTQASYAKAVAETEEDFRRVADENPDVYEKLADGKYRLIDPLDVDTLEEKEC